MQKMRTTSSKQSLANSPISTIEFSGHVFREDTFGIIKRLRFFFEHIELARTSLNLKVKDIRILDIGCGTGINVTMPLANFGYYLHGIDTDNASIEKAKIIAKNFQNLYFSCQQLTSVTTSDLFHVVVCSEVLEHLKRPDKLLKQIRSVLVDDGLILITVPNGYGYFELESALDQRFPMIANLADNIQQRIVRRFGSDALKQRHSKERNKEHYELACSSLDGETTHCNKFTYHKIKRIIQDNNYKIIDFHNRTFLAGNIINVLLRESDMLLKCNCAIADLLPKTMCSGWLIAAIKKKSP